MLLSNAKVGQKVLYNQKRGEIAYIPTIIKDKNHNFYNQVEVTFPNSPKGLGELINLSELTLIKSIEVTEDDLITCDSEICDYCTYRDTIKCPSCLNFDNFLGVEAYRTAED